MPLFPILVALAIGQMMEIVKALKLGQNKNYTVKEQPKLNHLFQTAKTGALIEYGPIAETIAPIAFANHGRLNHSPNAVM
jgi:hypothetical protein